MAGVPILIMEYTIMEFQFLTPYVISNFVAVVSVALALRWPTVARVLLSIIFIASAFLNAYVALDDPEIYLGYEELTPSELYRSLIVGPFSAHPGRYVLLIALGQLYIGLFTCHKGRMMKWAMIGGIIFLLAIAPLGIGSAFPCTVIIAATYGILLRKKVDVSIYELVGRRVQHSKI